MQKKISIFVLSCAILIAIQGFLVFNASAKDDIPIVTYDNNLKLVCNSNTDFFNFKNLLKKSNKEQIVIIKNNSDKKIDFYLQLINDIDTRYQNYKSEKSDKIYVQIKNKNDIMYKENITDFLSDIKINKRIRMVTLYPQEEAEITISILPKSLTGDEIEAVVPSYKILAMRKDAIVSVLDDNMRVKEMSQNRIIIKGSNHSPYIMKSMVYVSVAFVTVIGFIAIYVHTCKKYNNKIEKKDKKE